MMIDHKRIGIFAAAHDATSQQAGPIGTKECFNALRLCGASTYLSLHLTDLKEIR